MSTMTLGQQAATIAVVVAGTMLTRFLPFLIFPGDKPTPPYIQYLGRVLPFAVTGLLVVYCLRSVSFSLPPYGAAEALSILLIFFLHHWKRKMLLSIAGGTVLYMILIQFVFV